MHIVSTKIEKPRLNGYRKPGGLYLVGELADFQCCQLPLRLPADSVPKKGLVPVPDALIFSRKKFCRENDCPAVTKKNYAGMLWIEELHYPTAAFYFQEARAAGAQLLVKRLHCGIKPGTSWVLLAHRKAIVDYSDGPLGWVDSETGEAHSTVKYSPGVFAMVLIESIEYIVKKTETGRIVDKSPEVFEMAQAGVKLINVLHEEEVAASEYQETEKEEGYE